MSPQHDERRRRCRSARQPAAADRELRPTGPIDGRQAAFRARLLGEAELTIHHSASPENLELRLFQSLVELRGGRHPFRYWHEPQPADSG